ncbi:MAG: uroporphyrinogen-III synthase [Campylobacterota bacterium]|nr:uroporphyrinogen-III synthase [Campylobacterota bacterium]
MNIYILSDKKVDGAINLPVFKIDHIRKNIDFSSYDALVITSKNAIYSIESFDKSWREIPTYAIAKQTANTIEKFGGNLKFIGSSGHGDQFAKELIPKLKGKKVLYPRAFKVVSNLVDILNKNGVVCEESIVYETVCKDDIEDIKLVDKSIIIFSSPSTVNCFLENFIWDDSFRAICIGDTTAKYLPSYIKPIISDITSLNSCVQKAIELYY